MPAATFDALGYFEKLKAAGVPEEQARIQAEAMRGESEANAAALCAALKDYDAERKKNLATKGDVREAELRLQAEMKAMEIRLLKWQIGGWIALAAIMAKGFGWIGF